MKKKQPKLTPWFPRETPPARNGFYEIRFDDDSRGMRYWDGVLWRFSNETGTGPSRLGSYISNVNRDSGVKWRGLAVKP